MPKVSLVYKPDSRAVSRNIKRLMGESEIDKKTLAEDVPICYSTLCYKIKDHPESFTVKELAYIAKRFKVPVSALVEGV